MDGPPIPNSDSSDDVVVVEKLKPHKAQLKQLWAYNIGTELMIAVFHILLLTIVPIYYPFYHHQFMAAIVAALLNIFITFKMRIELLGLQIFYATAHFIWVFYCFATVPVFLTAISANHVDCIPKINVCTKEFLDVDSFYVKMVTGLAAQIYFLAILYGEMRRLVLLINFRFTVVPHIQPNMSEKKVEYFDGPIENELPEKNPNDIIIAA